jgi:hypothetical protein
VLEENHRLGTPNAFSRNGKLYYEFSAQNADITQE